MQTLTLLLLSGCGSVISFGGFRRDDPDMEVATTGPDDTGTPSTTTTPTTTETDDSGTTTTTTDTGDSGTTTASSSIVVSAYTGSWTAGTGVTELGVGVHPWFVGVGDFNDDGRDDLAFSWNVELFGGDELNLAVCFQDATGNLGAPVNLATGRITAFAGSFRVADLDNDGDDDLVAGHDDGVSVFLSDGAGAFTGPVDYTSAEGTAVRVGDLDADGDLDLVTVGTSGALQVWLNNGAAAFSSGWSGTTTTASHGEASTLLDLDGDSDLDLVIGDPDGMTIRFHGLLNDGTGTFDTSSPIPAPAENPMVTSLVGVDLDGDGTKEITATGMRSDTWESFVGGWDWIGGANGFGDYLHLWTPPGSSPTGITTGDLDGDGDDDIFAANALYLNGMVAFAEGGNAWSTVTLDLGYWNQSDIFPDPIAIGDLNGDGCGDLVWRTDEDIVVAPGSGC